MLILWGVIWGIFFSGMLGRDEFLSAIGGGFLFFAGHGPHLINKSKLKGAVVDEQCELAAA